MQIRTTQDPIPVGTNLTCSLKAQSNKIGLSLIINTRLEGKVKVFRVWLTGQGYDQLLGSTREW